MRWVKKNQQCYDVCYRQTIPNVNNPFSKKWGPDSASIHCMRLIKPYSEKWSTENRSTEKTPKVGKNVHGNNVHRKKRPLGNKVHLERVGKKGHESRKIGPQQANKKPSVQSGGCSRRCRRTLLRRQQNYASSCCGHAVAEEDEESCYSDTGATVATVHW